MDNNTVILFLPCCCRRERHCAVGAGDTAAAGGELNSVPCHDLTCHFRMNAMMRHGDVDDH